MPAMIAILMTEATREVIIWFTFKTGTKFTIQPPIKNPEELSRENMISSHLKITYYFHTSTDHSISLVFT